jgi:cytochrome c-type biogenesis protein CcmH/NrfF
MEDYSLTLGAHLLLWVFPLLLVVFVIVENLLDSRSRANDR